MSHVNNNESEHFSLENHSWENLFNDNSNDSIDDDDEKKQNDDEEVSKIKGKMKVKNVKRKEEDHGVHILTERERRKKMRDMFSNLHSLLPQLPPKADKSTVVDEAITYIKNLECTLKRLQQQKLERVTIPNKPLSTNNDNDNDKDNYDNNIIMTTKTSTNNSAPSSSNMPAIIRTYTSSNVVLNLCGNDVQFTVYALKKPQLFTALCRVLDKYKLDVVAVHVSSDVDRSVYVLHARVSDETSDELHGQVTVEDICKHAASEMMLCVST
ncbi:hypothetical protein vseg_006937 [Gypsophila vaccaria]